MGRYNEELRPYLFGNKAEKDDWFILGLKTFETNGRGIEPVVNGAFGNFARPGRSSGLELAEIRTSRELFRPSLALTC
jgi:hypothetical protein